ncbi:MAG: CAP domain-containing protein [Symploca sp. SIO3C6]|uniref:CAP domain-containing protein n=1 Tax=Symploca sp. SIO1C4 TaxID=2607765 RepID=A0A6B3ND98_9CYAN|nr:CAP domain-containing protein [Symploca sp. SIO3C6]NER31069.1 CAP domain-containing protein [Symploca sp. SIO1C4]
MHNSLRQQRRNSQPAQLSISGLEKKIHQLISYERRKYRLNSLQFDSQLADIARGHSKDMAKRNFFAHHTPEGKTPADRGIAANYHCRKDYGAYYTKGISENIFKSHLYSCVTYYNGVPYYDWMTQDKLANLAVNGWMSSPGHRKNILTATYDQEGIGVAVALERNEVYITQNFC